MPNPIDNGKPNLTETILNWTFREDGSIYIPKSYREKAVIMQLDIQIVSVSKEQFLNYESSPADGYYGYATLVMRDFCLPPIKISQPRQTLYYGRLDDAIIEWWDFHRSIRDQANYLGIESLISSVIQQLGGTVAPKECVPLTPPSWVELPLREVYINSQYGTQFGLELSYWSFSDMVDNCGNLVPAKSGQVDGDKDKGIRDRSGVQPNKATNPSTPYAGLSPVSTLENSPLGFIPPSKQSGLDEIDPENAPKPLRYSLGYIYYGYPMGCSQPRYRFFEEIGRYDEPPFAELGQTISTYTSCNGEVGGVYSYKVNGSVKNPSASSLLAGRGFSTRPFYDESELQGLYYPNGVVDS